jgi:hypothetical protein
LLSVEALDNTEHLSVFPNPVDQILHIENENAELVQIQIIDLFGKEVFKSTFNSSIDLDCTTFQSGIYFLHFEFSGKLKVLKVVKK